MQSVFSFALLFFCNFAYICTCTLSSGKTLSNKNLSFKHGCRQYGLTNHMKVTYIHVYEVPRLKVKVYEHNISHWPSPWKPPQEQHQAWGRRWDEAILGSHETWVEWQESLVCWGSESLCLCGGREGSLMDWNMIYSRRTLANDNGLPSHTSWWLLTHENPLFQEIMEQQTVFVLLRVATNLSKCLLWNNTGFW